MEIIAMVHRLRSVDKEEFWRWHVEMQAAEGLSARAYCRQQGLSAASFYAWRRELKRRDDGRALSPCSEKQAAAKQNAAKQSPAVRSKSDLRHSIGGAGLVALEIVSDSRPTRHSTLEIETSEGVVIRLREDVSINVLRRVIAACQQSHQIAACLEESLRREVRSC